MAVLALIGMGMGCLAAPNNSYIMRNVPASHSGLIGGTSGQTICQLDFKALFETGVLIGVIGRYGHVGQGICRELAKSYPGKIYATKMEPGVFHIGQLFCYESFERDLADIADMSSQVTVRT